MHALTQVLRKTHSNGHGPSAPVHDAAPAQTAFDSRARRAFLDFDVDVFVSARHFVVMDGRTGPVHGHSFRVRVRISQVVQSDRLEIMGSARTRELIRLETTKWNNRLLNEMPPFDGGPEMSPTIERMAMVLFRRLEQNVPAAVQLKSVSVWDSPTNKVTYAESVE